MKIGHALEFVNEKDLTRLLKRKTELSSDEWHHSQSIELQITKVTTAFF